MPNIYKKKSPKAPYIKQIILYSVMLILCLIVKMWRIIPVFIALIAFAAFMLYRNRDKDAHSLAEYIHGYDNDFPTENPKEMEKQQQMDAASKRERDYQERLAEIERDFDDFDYGEDDDDEE